MNIINKISTYVHIYIHMVEVFKILPVTLLTILMNTMMIQIRYSSNVT